MGALFGFLAGPGAGAILASVTYKPPKCAADTWCMDLWGQDGDTAAGGLLGVLTGVIIGSHETDDWVPVKLPTRN